MPNNLEERVNRLLDQLEDPNLTPREFELVKDKITYLQSLQQQ